MEILLKNELFHSKTKKKIKTLLEILYNWGNPVEMDLSILEFVSQPPYNLPLESKEDLRKSIERS